VSEIKEIETERERERESSIPTGVSSLRERDERDMRERETETTLHSSMSTPSKHTKQVFLPSFCVALFFLLCFFVLQKEEITTFSLLPWTVQTMMAGLCMCDRKRPITTKFCARVLGFQASALLRSEVVRQSVSRARSVTKILRDFVCADF
jgi:hypothetical protein